MWVNGHDYIDRAVLDNATVYTSPPVTISGHEYTKHYFMGSERIASNFGSGFANAVTPVSGTQTLISNPQGSLQIISNQLVDKLFRSWDCVGMIPEYVELQTDISVFNDLDAIDNENTVYFFHPDHLGSTSWILTGSTPIQHLQYLPFGEDYISEQNVNSTFNTNFTFSGKERDIATGYSYFGFRYYDPTTSIWLGVDPLSDKYPSHSPYNYCMNNPIMLVDPDGRSVEGGEHVPVTNGGVNSEEKLRIQKTFLDQVNEVTGGKYKIVKGELRAVRKNYGTGPNAELFKEAIESQNNIPINLVFNDPQTFIDGFLNTNIDVGDISFGNKAVKGLFYAHIMKERLAAGKSYENFRDRLADISSKNFGGIYLAPKFGWYHFVGINSEVDALSYHTGTNRSAFGLRKESKFLMPIQLPGSFSGWLFDYGAYKVEIKTTLQSPQYDYFDIISITIKK